MLDVFAHRFILIYISHSMQLIGFFASMQLLCSIVIKIHLGKVQKYMLSWKKTPTPAHYALLSDLSHVLIGWSSHQLKTEAQLWLHLWILSGTRSWCVLCVPSWSWSQCNYLRVQLSDRKHRRGLGFLSTQGLGRSRLTPGTCGLGTRIKNQVILAELWSVIL